MFFRDVLLYKRFYHEKQHAAMAFQVREKEATAREYGLRKLPCRISPRFIKCSTQAMLLATQWPTCFTEPSRKPHKGKQQWKFSSLKMMSPQD